MTAHTLEVSGVSKQFGGQTVLEDVSASIDATERVAIIGPSGAGKTTFLRLIAGAIEPDAGSITLNGEPIRRGEVAVAYQGDALVRSRTALQNVSAGELGANSWWEGLLDPIFRPGSQKAHEALAAVGLEDHKHERVDELSAGERGRVAVARALVQSGKALLADEPTANLDRTTQEQVLDVLEATAEGGLYLVVLHDVSIAKERFDRILGFRKGELRMDSPAAAVSESELKSLFQARTADSGSGTHTSAAANTTQTPPPWYV